LRTACSIFHKFIMAYIQFTCTDKLYIWKAPTVAFRLSRDKRQVVDVSKDCYCGQSHLRSNVGAVGSGHALGDKQGSYGRAGQRESPSHDRVEPVSTNKIIVQRATSYGLPHRCPTLARFTTRVRIRALRPLQKYYFSCCEVWAVFQFSTTRSHPHAINSATW
jgi:hypothetical protein